MDRCPLCGAPLVEIRAKAVCCACGRIVEGCCEGAPSPLECPAGVGGPRPGEGR